MKIKVEASHYIHTSGDQFVKKDLYLLKFSVNHIGNIHGLMPFIGVDFNETDEGYAKRLRTWKLADRDVLFTGWKVKDMGHWQVLQNEDSTCSINFEFSTYSILLYGKEYVFNAHPETIDDFITDCKRIGLKLFWNTQIIDKFGIDKITSSTKVLEYHKILRESLD